MISPPRPRVVHIGRIAGVLSGKPVAIEHGIVVDLGTPQALDAATNSGFVPFERDDDTLAMVTEPAAPVIPK